MRGIKCFTFTCDSKGLHSTEISSPLFLWQQTAEKAGKVTENRHFISGITGPFKSGSVCNVEGCFIVWGYDLNFSFFTLRRDSMIFMTGKKHLLTYFKHSTIITLKNAGSKIIGDHSVNLRFHMEGKWRLAALNWCFINACSIISDIQILPSQSILPCWWVFLLSTSNKLIFPFPLLCNLLIKVQCL